MLGLETQYRLRDFLSKIATLELSIEQQRQRLAKIPDFEPYAAFCRINRTGDKAITCQELNQFLTQNGVTQFSDRDCQYIILYFDTDQDNALSYKESMELMLPCDDLYLRSEVTQRHSRDCPQHEMLSSQVERELAFLIEKEIEFHQHIEIVKRDLLRRYDWTHQVAFQSIDQHRDGFIAFNSLSQFCRQNGYNPSEQDVVAMIRRLDVDGDQRIKYDEFVRTFTPVNPIIGKPIAAPAKVTEFKHTSPLKQYPLRASPQSYSKQRNYNVDYMDSQSKVYSGQRVKPQSPNHVLSPEIQTGKRNNSPLRQKSPAYQRSAQRDTSPPKQRSPLRQSPQSMKPLRYSPYKHDTASKVSDTYKPFDTFNKESSASSSRSSVTKRLVMISNNKKHSYQPDSPNDSGHRQPLNFEEEENLVSALREQVRNERQIEDAKIRLAGQQDFNLMDAYQMLDRNSKGWVTVPEMIEALADYGVFPHKEDVYLFMRRYDRDSDGRLLFSDFCDAFCPSEIMVAQTLNKREAYHLHRGYAKPMYFCTQTRDIYFKTMRLHFTVEESNELLRKRLSKRPNFSLHQVFSHCDTDQLGYLTGQDLRRVLAENQVFVSDSELKCLVSRYDTNGDGRISYSEFVQELSPKLK